LLEGDARTTPQAFVASLIFSLTKTIRKNQPYAKRNTSHE
jgi:hypothetical protein